MNKSSLEKKLKPGDIVEIKAGITQQVGYFLRIDQDQIYITKALQTEDFKIYTPSSSSWEREQGYLISRADITLVKRASVKFSETVLGRPAPDRKCPSWGD